jgi:FtsH-binding integral membrane protein
LARKVPVNFIILFIFTLSESVIISLTTLRYDPQTVLNAALLTLALVIALTVYAFNTKTDFTMMGGILYIFLVTLIMVSILGFFFPSKLLRTIISGCGVILFSFYLIYDTQVILGNGSLALTIDDYIFAALNLYLDVVNLFLYILSLLGDSSN